MRDLFLGVAIPATLVWALFSAQGSILVLNWIWFQRPYDFSWGFWNSMPLFQIALAIAILSNLLRGQLQPKFPPVLVVYVLFLVWITLSTAFAFNSNLAWEYYRTFLPSMWVAPLVLFATIHDLRLLKWVLWVAAGGIGFNAAKTGVSLSLAGGGHLTDQISGFVGDNNVFGLVLCLVVATLMGLRTDLPRKWWVQSAFYGFIAAIVLCIIYTKSRGALITLGLLFSLASLFGPRAIRSLLALFAIAAIGYWIVPQGYFDRLDTLSELKSDVSAMGRLENWTLAWEAALRNPLLGVGPNNHIAYNHALFPEVQVRVAHSVYFQILGELGFVGLFLYLWFMILVFRSFGGALRGARLGQADSADIILVRSLAFWLLCGFAAYSVGAGLLNMLYIEFPWYVAFYGSMLSRLSAQQAPTSSLARVRTTSKGIDAVLRRTEIYAYRRHKRSGMQKIAQSTIKRSSPTERS